MVNLAPDSARLQLHEALLISSRLQQVAVAPRSWVVLDGLAAQAANHVAYYDSDHARVLALHEWFFREARFGANIDNCLAVDNGLVDMVLEKRQGSPIVLTLLFAYFAQCCGLSAHAVAFPGYFMVSIDDGDQMRFLDAMQGEWLSQKVLSGILRGSLGQFAQLEPQHLQPATLGQVKQRLLAGLKAALIRESRHAEALQCCDMLLELNPDDASEIRDRAFLLQELSCFDSAAKDLAYYIKQRPKDPINALLKMQLKELQSHSTTFH